MRVCLCVWVCVCVSVCACACECECECECVCVWVRMCVIVCECVCVCVCVYVCVWSCLFVRVKDGEGLRGRFGEQKLKLSCCFTCDQIFKNRGYGFGHNLLRYLGITSFVGAQKARVLPYTRLYRLARHKHSSLLRPFVSYKENGVLWTRPLKSFINVRETEPNRYKSNWT